MKHTLEKAFSLVEVLAAVSIIGIITFLALPNIVKVKEGSEENLAIARAENMNMAMASLIQTRGKSQAVVDWTTAATDEARYNGLMVPFLSFAPSLFADYMPGGYSIDLPDDLTVLEKAELTGPHGAIAY